MSGLWGCGNDNVAGVSSQYSIIKGVVTDDSGSYSLASAAALGRVAAARSLLPGATVVAKWAPGGGTLQAISDTTETDAAGRFSLTCQSTNINNVTIVATKGSTVREAIVGSNLSLGGTEYSQPLTGESTVQAQVYSAMAGGAGPGAATLADIVEVVSAPVAAAAGNSLADIDELATSIEAGDAARLLSLQNFSVGSASMQAASAIELLRTSAEQDLESSLFTAGENAAMSAHAYMDFLHADENAYLLQGVGRLAVAEIYAICARGEMNHLVGPDSTFDFALVRQTSLVTAYMVIDAIDSSLEGLLATQVQLDSANAAGETLTNAIQNSPGLAAVDASLRSYHDTIIRLTDEVIGGSMASHVSSIDSTINNIVGLRPNLLKVASLPLSANDLVQAYSSFFQAVESECTLYITSLPGVEKASVAAILILTNMTDGLT